MGSMSSTTTFSSYEEAREQHRWEVPARYNIAVDVCDRHPRDKLAMIHEDFGGRIREVSWGELQDDSNRFANVLRSHGVEQGDRVAMLLPPTPETAAAFFGVWKAGAILLSMSVLYGDEGIRHRVRDSQPRVLVTNEANAGRVERDLVEHVLILDDELLGRGSTTFDVVDTAADDPAQLYYSSGTTGLAKGILHAHRYILAHEEFIYCHDLQDGEVFHGMGEWAWAAGICPLLGPWRLGAVQAVYQREGGFDPHRQLDFLSRHAVTNVFGTPTAIRSMMSILDEDERPVASGERGEICLKARSNPHYPLGYWNRPDEDTQEAFGGDWFHTKDAASADEDGYFWYEGRADDVIIASGYRIGPFEVESACLEHPAVAEAAAVASPDERRGNIVKAFVVVASGHEPSEELAEEIKAFVRDRHSAYAYPRLIEFVPELPKTLTGKIRRIELRQREYERRPRLVAEPA